MAQSGYLFLENEKWKVRYRIKDEVGVGTRSPTWNEARFSQAKRCQGRHERFYGEAK